MLRAPLGQAASRRTMLELVMQRQDIADYLGLTIETVSRTFTLFKERGLHHIAAHAPRPDAAPRRAGADRRRPTATPSGAWTANRRKPPKWQPPSPNFGDSVRVRPTPR